MTPEERLTKIENALQSLTEVQARHDTQIGDLITQMEKQNGGIRDLIVVSRPLLESQKTIVESQKEVTEQIGQLTQKIDRLTDNIDKLVRRGPNGQA